VTGAVVWLTGPPASGKSTLARHLAERLRARGAAPLILDGDDVRAALVPAPGYDEPGREAFYCTLGNLACLVARQGPIAIVAATAHRRVWRDRVRAAAPRFVEVHVATPLEECRRRDPKGLYAASPAALPGAGLSYEPPLAPEVVAPGGDDDDAIDAIIARLGL
jgi:adenylylsulfate kinase